MTNKQEIVCITRHGLSHVACYGVDSAGSVTYHAWDADDKTGRSTVIRSFWLVPRGRPGDYTTSW